MKKELGSELLSFNGKWGYFFIEGKYYEMGTKDGAPVFKEIPQKEIDQREKMSRELAGRLKDGVDAEKVLVEAFMTRFSKADLEKIYKAVTKGKRKLVARTREHHCVDMKVGNFIVPL